MKRKRVLKAKNICGSSEQTNDIFFYFRRKATPLKRAEINGGGNV